MHRIFQATYTMSPSLPTLLSSLQIGSKVGSGEAYVIAYVIVMPLEQATEYVVFRIAVYFIHLSDEVGCFLFMSVFESTNEEEDRSSFLGYYWAGDGSHTL